MINIYVGNLPFRTTETELAELFSQHGQVIRSSIIMHRETGRSRGFGFVEMADPDDAKLAITTLNGAEFAGRVLTVNEARPRGGPQVDYRARA